MNLHEYQGKQLLASYGVNIQNGEVATTVEEAIKAYKNILQIILKRSSYYKRKVKIGKGQQISSNSRVGAFFCPLQQGVYAALVPTKTGWKNWFFRQVTEV